MEQYDSSSGYWEKECECDEYAFCREVFPGRLRVIVDVHAGIEGK